jgi:hypothetical protein
MFDQQLKHAKYFIHFFLLVTADNKYDTYKLEKGTLIAYP